MVYKLEPKCDECFKRACKLKTNPTLEDTKKASKVKLLVKRSKNGDLLSEETFDLDKYDTVDFKQIKQTYDTKASIVKFLHNFENKMDAGMFLPVALLNYFVTKIIKKEFKNLTKTSGKDGTVNFTEFNFEFLNMVIKIGEKGGAELEYDRLEKEVVADHELLKNIIKSHYLHECLEKDYIMKNLNHLKTVFEHMVDDLDMILLGQTKNNITHFKINGEFLTDDVSDKEKEVLVNNIIAHYCKIYTERFSEFVNSDGTEDEKEQKLSNFIIHIVHTYGKAFNEMFGKVLNYDGKGLEDVDEDVRIKIENLREDNSIRKSMTKLKWVDGDLKIDEDEFKRMANGVNNKLRKTPYSLFTSILTNIAKYYLANKPAIHLQHLKDKIKRMDVDEDKLKIKDLIKEYNDCVESFRNFTLSIFTDKNVSRWLHISERAMEEDNKQNRMFFATLLQISEIVYVFNENNKLVYPFFKCVFGNYKDMLRVLNDLFIDQLVKMNHQIETYLDHSETEYFIKVFDESGKEIKYENKELNSKNFMLMSCKNCT